MDSDCKANTDREIYRVTPGDYYADSIFVTEEGYIGINCGGFVAVLPLKTWHSLASGTRPEAAKGLTPLERYGAVVLDAHREEIGDLDGGFLQDQAEACGLLHYVDANEPCEGYCRCAEYDPAFPQRCLRIKPEIKERMEIDLRVPQARTDAEQQ